MDTNILFHAFHSGSGYHAVAREFLMAHVSDCDFAVCELVLMEFYGLIRNPAVVEKPLGPEAAVEVCQTFRHNRHWRVLDYPGGLMSALWSHAAAPGFARRRIYDARLALTLRYHGVEELATRNPRDFQNFGFTRVWDPLTADG